MTFTIGGGGSSRWNVILILFLFSLIIENSERKRRNREIRNFHITDLSLSGIRVSVFQRSSSEIDVRSKFRETLTRIYYYLYFVRNI